MKWVNDKSRNRKRNRQPSRTTNAKWNALLLASIYWDLKIVTHTQTDARAEQNPKLLKWKEMEINLVACSKIAFNCHGTEPINIYCSPYFTIELCQFKNKFYNYRRTSAVTAPPPIVTVNQRWQARFSNRCIRNR